jgi:carbonic anhydrase/acetyltransferase-like protein (isoleucine patch superfamily)
MIQSLKGTVPKIGEGTWIAPTAVIIGDVEIGKECSIWYHVVIRGDVNEIRIGDETNIQDGTVIHATYQKHGTYIGSRVTIGHKAVIHACTLEDESFVGIGAILLDGVIVPSHTMVAAGALVPPYTHLEKGYLYAGVPAKKIRPLTNEEIQQFIRNTYQNYLLYKSWYDSEANTKKPNFDQ